MVRTVIGVESLTAWHCHDLVCKSERTASVPPGSTEWIVGGERMASKGRRQRALEVVHPNCAGIDVGKAMHYVAVDASKAARPVRQSGSFTEDPDVMARWLSSCGDSGSERWTAPGGTTAVAVTGAGG